MTIRSDCGGKRVLVLVSATAMLASVFVAPAFAASDHVLQFTFAGPGRNPSVERMERYIMGCLPAGTFTFGADPGNSAGPWNVQVPERDGTEYTNAGVRVLLMSHACAPVRPAKVHSVVVTG